MPLVVFVAMARRIGGQSSNGRSGRDVRTILPKREREREREREKDVLRRRVS